MKVIIVSGYFNPIHIGHINNFRAAKKLGDKLWVIVNNDRQQKLKKGKIIMKQKERVEIVKAIKYVDNVILAIDPDKGVSKTLSIIARKNKKNKVFFAKGGDRTIKNIPQSEIDVCKKYNIKIISGVGGKKVNSSSKINKLRGKE